MKFKRSKGITLISLVVTIIVLLILAGILILMLTGQNGILNNTTVAKEETQITEEFEQIQLVAMASLIDGLGTVNYENLDKELNKVFDADYFIISENKNDANEWIVELRNQKYSIDKNGDVKKIEIANYIISENYGDYIDYKMDLNGDGDTTNDWKIFFNDGVNVYIISTDYVLNQSLDTYYSNYTHILSKVLNHTEYIDIEMSKIYKNWHKGFSLDGTNNNQKAVRYLLDSRVWNEYYKNDYAEYAIGGATIEMWVASWNQKGYTKLYCNNNNNNGYYIGDKTEPLTYTYEIKDDGLEDVLYFPHRQVWNSVYGYWLASPSANGSNYIMREGCEGAIYRYGSGSTGMGLRPVVCLNKDVIGKYEDGIWRLEL